MRCCALRECAVTKTRMFGLVLVRAYVSLISGNVRHKALITGRDGPFVRHSAFNKGPDVNIIRSLDH